LLASHHGSPGSTPGLVKWDLWWTKWHWGRFSGAGTIGQKWLQCKGLGPTPLAIKKIHIVQIMYFSDFANRWQASTENITQNLHQVSVIVLLLKA
jgi:hypothetical protein